MKDIFWTQKIPKKNLNAINANTFAWGLKSGTNIVATICYNYINKDRMIEVVRM